MKRMFHQRCYTFRIEFWCSKNFSKMLLLWDFPRNCSFIFNVQFPCARNEILKVHKGFASISNQLNRLWLFFSHIKFRRITLSHTHALSNGSGICYHAISTFQTLEISIETLSYLWIYRHSTQLLYALLIYLSHNKKETKKKNKNEKK